MVFDKDYTIFEDEDKKGNLIRENVIFIKGDALESFSNYYKYKSILHRLDNLSLDCAHGNFSACQVYDKCNSLVAIYVQNNDYDTLEELNLHAQDIIGFAIAIHYFDQYNTVEIWNVCVDQKHRGKKVASHILDSIIEHIPFDIAWLAILFDNTYWDDALRVYTNKGFAHPEATKTTKSGLWLNDLDVLGLTYVRGEQVDKNATIEIANEIRNNYITRFSACITKLSMSPKMLKSLRKWVYEDREYGGNIDLVSKVNGVWTTRYGPDPLYKGTDPLTEGYTVTIPNLVRINFHTHPDVCYEEFGCYILWPSGQDIAHMIPSYFIGEYKHYVISREGVWSLQLTVSFMQFLESIGANNMCVDKFQVIVREVMENVEDYRVTENFIHTQDQERTVRMILETFRTYNIQNLLADYRRLRVPDKYSFFEGVAQILESCVGNSTFTLFNLRLYRWEHIEDRGLRDTMYTPKNVFCWN